MAYTGLDSPNCKLSVSSWRRALDITAHFRRRESSPILRFGSRWTHIAPRWWMAEVHRPDSASCSQGRLHPELPEEWSTAYATSSRGAAACWALLLRIDSLSTRPGGGRHAGACGGTGSAPVIPK